MSETGAESNADFLDLLMGQLSDTFDLTRQGTTEESLGKDLLAMTATGIVSRTLGDQMDPDNGPLAPNQGKYAAKKATRGLPIGVGLDPQSNDRMLSFPQMLGEQSITPDAATMRYGITDAARKKAEWFTAGSNDGLGIERSGAENQAERPFYALDELLEGELIVLCDEHIERTLADLNATAGGF